MSTAVATRRFCACGCGKTVKGNPSYFNATCRQRAHRAGPEKRVYPHYLSATERLEKCAKHAEVYSQHSYQFQEGSACNWGVIGSASGRRPNYGLMIWNGTCPECDRETAARLEALKPKPNTSPCANRTCECLQTPPKCKYCHQPMTLLPNSLAGIHEWACGVVPAIVEARPATAGDEKRREMAEPERQRVGEHHRSWPGGTFMTAWRD